MLYNDLLLLYFERSNSLQWYWTLYVIVIGGLLGYSSFRLKRDLIKTILVCVMFSLFAYKNLDSIHDVTVQRFATLRLIKEFKPLGPDAAEEKRMHEVLDPTLVPAEFEGMLGTRNFHILCDLLTIAALWIMESHRKKDA